LRVPFDQRREVLAWIRESPELAGATSTERPCQECCFTSGSPGWWTG